MADIAFFESITPYWVDFHRSLHNSGYAIYYLYDSIYGYDSAMLKEKSGVAASVMNRRGKNVIRIFELLSLLRKHKPRVVISVEFSFLTLQLLMLRPFFGFKLVTRCDDSVELIDSPYSAIHGAARKVMAPFVDDVILCDSRTVDFYRNRYGKGIYFPIVRDDGLFRADLCRSLEIAGSYMEDYVLGEKPVVLFVGRLVAVKNIPSLLKAVDSVTTPLDVVIVGEGEDRGKLEKIAAGMKHRVLFAGKQSEYKLWAWYTLADIFVLPSFHEPFGAVVNEALIAGLHCIVSNRAGAATLINADNGIVVNPYDTESISSALSALLPGSFAKRKDCLRDSLMPFPYDEVINNLIQTLSHESRI